MASTWGTSWGDSWAVSWDILAPAPTPTPTPTPTAQTSSLSRTGFLGGAWYPQERTRRYGKRKPLEDRVAEEMLRESEALERIDALHRQAVFALEEAEIIALMFL